MQTYFTLNEHILRRRQEAAATWRAAFASPAPGGPGSAFALGASGERQRPEGVLSEPPGLRPLRMSSLHALGSRVRGPTGCAASDAALPVPDWATEATAAAAAAAAGLRTAAQQAAPLGHAAAQADSESVARALAKARSLRRLARDVEAGAGPLKALKRRARGRERAEVHRGSLRESSTAPSENRSGDEHFSRSAAAQAADEAAALAALGPPTLGSAKRARESTAQRQRHRHRRKLNLRRRRAASDDTDEGLREDASSVSFVGRDRPPYWAAALRELWSHCYDPGSDYLVL